MKSASLRASARSQPDPKIQRPESSHPLQLSLIGLLMLVTLISIDLALFVLNWYAGVVALFCLLPALSRTVCITIQRWLVGHSIHGRDVVELLLFSTFVSGAGVLILLAVAYVLLMLPGMLWQSSFDPATGNRTMQTVTFVSSLIGAGYVSMLWFQWTWPEITPPSTTNVESSVPFDSAAHPLD